jgi:hypothetical protein
LDNRSSLLYTVSIISICAILGSRMASTSSVTPETIDSSHGGLIDVVAAASAEEAISGSCCSVRFKGSGIYCSSGGEEAKASCCDKDDTDVGCCDGPKETACLACEEEKTSCCNKGNEGGADGCGGQKELAGLACGGEKGGCCDEGKLKDGREKSCGKQEVDDQENLDDGKLR